MTFRIMPRNSIALADLKDPVLSKDARSYDSGRKGYLTTEEAFRFYAARNDNKEPSNIQEVIAFLGGAQHPMTQRHVDSYDLANPWQASNWKGDFHIDGSGAGNVRTGRDVRPTFGGGSSGNTTR